MLDLSTYTMFMCVIGLRIFVLTLLNELDFNPAPNAFSNFHDPAWSIYQVTIASRVQPWQLSQSSQHGEYIVCSPPGVPHHGPHGPTHTPTPTPNQVSNIMALTAILMWLKLLRYLQLSARLSQLTQTIARAAIDMANFRSLTLIRTLTRTRTDP